MEQQKLSFMVIDDSELDCFIARKFIEHTDKSLQTVTYLNAKLAIAQIRKDADNRNMPLTIILLDLRMPIMNGFQFVDQFEKLPMDITINRAYEKYLEKIELKEMNEKLAGSNDQLEFLLRQKLLS